jgi:ATP-dependent Lon protease
MTKEDVPVPEGEFRRFWIDQTACYELYQFLEQSAKTQDGDRALRGLLEGVMLDKGWRVFERSWSWPDVKALKLSFPNFAEVVDFVTGQLALMDSEGAQPRRLSPMLLLGDPGIGKTHFAQSLAQALNVPMQLISMNTATSGFGLSGLDRAWSGAKQGEIFNTLMRQRCINPVVVLDELDKSNKEAKSDPIGPLYQLLESDTSIRFVDEFVTVPINAGYVSFICTANEIAQVPDPIQSRLRVFNIERPTSSQMVPIVSRMYSNLRKSTPALSAELPPEVIAHLCQMTPRAAKGALHEAAGRAASNHIGKGKPFTIEPVYMKSLQARKPHSIGFV